MPDGLCAAASWGDDWLGCAREAGEDAGLALDADGLIFGEKKMAGKGLAKLGGAPFGLHDAAGIVAG